MAESQFPGLPQIMDKQFWTRPEGKFGVVALAALAIGSAAGAVVFLPAVLTYLAGIFASIFSIVAHGVGAFALIYAFFIDDKLRNLLGFGYRSFMRWLTGLIINLSPVAVVRDYIDLLKKRMTKMEQAIGSLKKQVASLAQLIQKNESEIQDGMKRLSVARKQGKNLQGLQESQIAGLLQKSNENLKKLHTKMELVYRVLLKMREAAKFSVDVTERKVDIAIREASALSAGSSAVKEAMAIIYGDPQKKEWFDRAMGELAWTTASAVAEIDNFMEMSESFFNSVDLERAVADEDAMKMLEKWERDLEGGVLLGGGDKAAIVNDTHDPNTVLDLNQTLSTNRLMYGAPASVKDYFN